MRSGLGPNRLRTLLEVAMDRKLHSVHVTSSVSWPWALVFQFVNPDSAALSDQHLLVLYPRSLEGLDPANDYLFECNNFPFP